MEQIAVLITILSISYLAYNMYFKLDQSYIDYEVLKGSVEPNKLLQQIIPYVNIDVTAGNEESFRVIKWTKNLIVPINYNAYNSEIIVITDIPENETVKYAIMNLKDDINVTDNPGLNNVIFIYTTGKVKVVRLLRRVAMDIFDIPLYRCHKMYKTLVETKEHLTGLIKTFSSTGDTINNEVVELKKNLMLVEKELQYYKKHYPEYII